MSGSYSHAGVSKLDGEFKVRFANDALRVKVLAKNGHKGIDIVELKHPMNKADAVAYLLLIDFDNGNKEVRAALEGAADKRSEKPAKAAPVAKAAPKAKPEAKKAAPKVKKTAVATTVVAKEKAEPMMTKQEAHAVIMSKVGEALM